MNLNRALYFGVEGMNRRRVLLCITLYYYFNFGNVRNLLIKPYRIYEIYTAITLYYIAFGIIRGSRKGSRSWNVLPVDTGFLLYMDWVRILPVLTAVL
jgi:hypothetical protein